MTGIAPVKVVRDQLMLGPVRVEFQRTLRIPEAGLHPLPPGLGRFPLRRVEDYPDTAQAEWLARGGVMLPIYQREAMWLSFDASESDLFELFNGVGSVQNVEVVVNRHTMRSKGFAFVQMQSIDEAKRAVDDLHNKEYMGRKLVVSGAKALEERRSERSEQTESPSEPVAEAAAQ